MLGSEREGCVIIVNFFESGLVHDFIDRAPSVIVLRCTRHEGCDITVGGRWKQETDGSGRSQLINVRIPYTRYSQTSIGKS